MSTADFYAEMICDELNIKQLTYKLGVDEEGREITAVYEHDTLGDNHVPLKLYADDEVIL